MAAGACICGNLRPGGEIIRSVGDSSVLRASMRRRMSKASPARLFQVRHGLRLSFFFLPPPRKGSGASKGAPVALAITGSRALAQRAVGGLTIRPISLRSEIGALRRSTGGDFWPRAALSWICSSSAGPNLVHSASSSRSGRSAAWAEPRSLPSPGLHESPAAGAASNSTSVMPHESALGELDVLTKTQFISYVKDYIHRSVA
jgi:hypothetical protein